MRQGLLTTLAGAALIAGGGLAAAQHMESSPGGASGAQGSSERAPGGAAHERQPGAMQGPAQGRSGAEQSRGGVTEQRSVGSVTLSPVQRTKIHETIISGNNIHRVDHVDFWISVGVRVPDTVTFYDIPETIVDIVPQYRGFRYIVVEEQLVIIDPDTLEIVVVLPA